MTYARALYYFIKNDQVNSKRFIKLALEANINVPKFLLDLKIIDLPIPDTYTSGDEVEAMHYYEIASHTWLSAEKALYWLTDEYYDYVIKNDIKVDFVNKDEVLERVDMIYQMMDNK